ncbi:hypothetical protein KY084_02265 [Stakelama sp. CBK3Z-3]|uniref:Anti-sigma factor NepR domain-containing protein n=2 Tax=Stakelama flava TaxID=2860338 RepID=A0ABS6XHJ8_9SPHN|nr:hypothetical protein [Stakelama flava]
MVRSDADRQESDDAAAKGGKPNPDRKTNPDADVGNALRAVYREAIDEDVPDDLMNLLKKLG